jgi:hypothetical protein
MLACPHCQERTDVPRTVNFWMVHAASAACEDCGKQFIIVDNSPMTEAQYQAVSQLPAGSVSTALISFETLTPILSTPRGCRLLAISMQQADLGVTKIVVETLLEAVIEHHSMSRTRLLKLPGIQNQQVAWTRIAYLRLSNLTVLRAECPLLTSLATRPYLPSTDRKTPTRRRGLSWVSVDSTFSPQDGPLLIGGHGS